MRDTTYDGMADLLETAQRHAVTATAARSDLTTAGGNHQLEVSNAVHDHAQAAVHMIDRIGCAFRQMAWTAETVEAGRRGLVVFNPAFPDLATPEDHPRPPLLIDPSNGSVFHEDGSYSFTAQYVSGVVALTPVAMSQLANAVREAHGRV